MDYVILMAVLITYTCLSSKINNITSNSSLKNKKSFPSLKELIGKNIELDIDDYIDIIDGKNPMGVLIDYNDAWIIMETKDKKNKNELLYFRLNNISSINVIDTEEK